MTKLHRTAVWQPGSRFNHFVPKNCQEVYRVSYQLKVASSTGIKQRLSCSDRAFGRQTLPVDFPESSLTTVSGLWSRLSGNEPFIDDY
jgi:hypothetical protein